MNLFESTSDESASPRRHLALIRGGKVALIGVLVGMLSTVAVAWGSVWWLTPEELSSRVRHRDDDDLIRSGATPRFLDPAVSDVLGYASWWIMEMRWRGVVRVMSRWDPPRWGGGGSGGWPDDPPEPLCPPWAPFVHPTEHPRTTGRTAVIAEARGWPMLALAGGFVQTERRVEQTGVSQLSVASRTAILLDSTGAAEMNGWQHAIVIPLRPIPLGFIVNTLLYGTIAVLLWLGMRWTRAVIRRRRGACGSCGHLLAGLTHCPECGHSFAGR